MIDLEVSEWYGDYDGFIFSYYPLVMMRFRSLCVEWKV